MDDLTAFEIRAVPAVARGTFHFDSVRYDAASDVIHLTTGPDAACVTERSPEGFLMRIDALENRVIGLEIDNARRRILADAAGPLEVTVGPGQRLAFDRADLRRIMSGGRFARRPAGAAADGSPVDAGALVAGAADAVKATGAKRFER